MIKYQCQKFVLKRCCKSFYIFVISAGERKFCFLVERFVTSKRSWMMIVCNIAVVPIQGICYWMIFSDLGGEVDDNVRI